MKRFIGNIIFLFALSLLAFKVSTFSHAFFFSSIRRQMQTTNFGNVQIHIVNAPIVHVADAAIFLAFFQFDISMQRKSFHCRSHTCLPFFLNLLLFGAEFNIFIFNLISFFAAEHLRRWPFLVRINVKRTYWVQEENHCSMVSNKLRITQLNTWFIIFLI